LSADKPGKPTPAALRRELRRLARDFADDVVAVLEEHGMWDEPELDEDELAARRVRRSPGDLQQVMTIIVAELKRCTEPVSIGYVAEVLGTTSRQITHPMSLLVDEGKVERSGARRGARYQVKKRKRPAKKATKARKP
jgi:predicted HTH transcriptional regulator